MSDIAAFANERDEDEIWRRWLSCPWVRRFESGQCSEDDFGRGMVESWLMPVSPEAFLEAFAVWPKGFLPGARELVEATSDRIRVACLSNTNSLHSERHWGNFGIHDLFDGLYFSHETGLLKPDREAFEFVAESLGSPRERILFLDDNQLNVEGARAAGLTAERAVGVDAAREILRAAKILP